jgi:hypothetical protein
LIFSFVWETLLAVRRALEHDSVHGLRVHRFDHKEDDNMKIIAICAFGAKSVRFFWLNIMDSQEYLF